MKHRARHHHYTWDDTAVFLLDHHVVWCDPAIPVIQIDESVITLPPFARRFLRALLDHAVEGTPLLVQQAAHLVGNDLHGLLPMQTHLSTLNRAYGVVRTCLRPHGLVIGAIHGGRLVYGYFLTPLGPSSVVLSVTLPETACGEVM